LGFAVLGSHHLHRDIRRSDRGANLRSAGSRPRYSSDAPLGCFLGQHFADSKNIEQQFRASYHMHTTDPIRSSTSVGISGRARDRRCARLEPQATARQRGPRILARGRGHGTRMVGTLTESNLLRGARPHVRQAASGSRHARFRRSLQKLVRLYRQHLGDLLDQVEVGGATQIRGANCNLSCRHRPGLPATCLGRAANSGRFCRMSTATSCCKALTIVQFTSLELLD